MSIVLSCALVAVTMVGHNPDEIVVSEGVDLVEVNHFYDENGKLVFDQVIFYDWCPEQSRFNVRAWRLLKQASQFPRKNWTRESYDSIWRDGDVIRRVTAKSFRETWTQYDPELVERAALPKEKRRELRLVGAPPKTNRR